MARSRVAIAERSIDTLLNELRALHTTVARISALQDGLQAALMALVNGPAVGQDISVKSGKKWQIYLKEWRTTRAKTLDDVGKVVGLSRGQISRVENGRQPYSQRILEGYAEVLGCRPGDLHYPPPVPPEPAPQPRLQLSRAARSGQDRVASRAT